MYIKNILIPVMLLAFASMAYAQENDSHQHHEHEHHHHHLNEASIGAGVVILSEENEVVPGIHAHYIRGLGHEKKFGVGLGLETILDEHRHYVTSIVFQYRVYKGWFVGYAPGLMFAKENDAYHTTFAQHIETGYEFEVGNLHIGPMAEVGLEEHGTHYMLGIHLGIDF